MANRATFSSGTRLSKLGCNGRQELPEAFVFLVDAGPDSPPGVRAIVDPRLAGDEPFKVVIEEFQSQVACGVGDIGQRRQPTVVLVIQGQEHGAERRVWSGLAEAGQIFLVLESGRQVEKSGCPRPEMPFKQRTQRVDLRDGSRLPVARDFARVNPSRDRS